MDADAAARFLATHSSPARAYAALRESGEWRRREGLAGLLGQPAPHLEAIKRAYPHGVSAWGGWGGGWGEEGQGTRGGARVERALTLHPRAQVLGWSKKTDCLVTLECDGVWRQAYTTLRAQGECPRAHTEGACALWLLAAHRLTRLPPPHAPQASATAICCATWCSATVSDPPLTCLLVCVHLVAGAAPATPARHCAPPHHARTRADWYFKQLDARPLPHGKSITVVDLAGVAMSDLGEGGEGGLEQVHA